VFANELRFEDGKLEPRFPWRDASCARCAHCKGVRVRAAIAGHRVFVGDGLSDVCGALAADVVFAKDSLAADLERRGVAFRRYASLAEVLAYLEAPEHQRLTHPEGAAR
jgi:2-hydroxy-3-keto-5-methylthiopentenyl-1-phosphate phosphatase